MTLFHITAGEPWPEDPPLFDEDGTVDWKVCSYHMAYEISVNWVILQARIQDAYQLAYLHTWLAGWCVFTELHARAPRR